MKKIEVKINWFVQAEFAVYQKLSDLWKVFLTVLMNKQGELGSALLFFSFFFCKNTISMTAFFYLYILCNGNSCVQHNLAHNHYDVYLLK